MVYGWFTLVCHGLPVPRWPVAVSLECAQCPGWRGRISKLLISARPLWICHLLCKSTIDIFPWAAVVKMTQMTAPCHTFPKIHENSQKWAVLSEELHEQRYLKAQVHQCPVLVSTSTSIASMLQHAPAGVPWITGEVTWQSIDSSKVKFANSGSPGQRIWDAKFD